MGSTSIDGDDDNFPSDVTFAQKSFAAASELPIWEPYSTYSFSFFAILY
jgi:hypothetical protein